jgi:hypothetical protein
MGLPVVTKSFQKVIVWVENVGNWDLILDYWADYRASLEEKSTVPVTINSNTDGTVSLWDVAKWDEASWDSYMSQPKALVFNLNAQQGNNNVGEVLKLRFRNQNSDEPITVFGFTVVWTESGLRK